MKNYIVAAVIIGLSIIVGLAFFGGKTVIEYGTGAGPEWSGMQYFRGGLVYGGDTKAMSTTSASVCQMTATEFCDYSYLSLNDYESSSTILYLPTNDQLSGRCLFKIGDTKEVLFRNTATDTTGVTVTASSGISLLEPSGGDVVIQTNISGALDEYALISCKKYDASNTACLVTSIQDAD